MPLTQKHELAPFIQSMTSCPKHGLHNPLKNVERYILYGQVCAKAGAMFREEKVADYFAKLVQRTSPKSYYQARNEVRVTGKFLENFSGDQVRFLARSFGVPGDHKGQASHGYRWPYGPVALITPFNFPIEIPLLQMMGALFMGNKVLLKVDSKVSIVMQETLRLLHECGMPMTDVDFVHSDGGVMNELLLKIKPRNTLFTGYMHIRHHCKEFCVRIPANTSAPCQDAYACSGQKCSAQSALFMHKNWVKAGLEKKLAELASRRKLSDLTIGPVLTVTTKRMLEHADSLLKIPGARVAFGAEELENHTIPERYGAVKPTAIFVPLKEFVKPENFELVTTEIFGPFQILTEYDDNELPLVLDALERMEAHLTAAVVSNDLEFTHEVLAATVNGTTYSGIRARTTGAPQNHWFGPAGDPCAGGIGTPEAIKMVWSCHREIINDVGPVPAHWAIPEAT
uniref:Aldehyde dehydrogenase domain-containing protein n=1 Tax=Hyaloperonospora arabidopsidis (strain Emoy2) TaxID=559515 RepID=M4B5F0_HYAAE